MKTKKIMRQLILADNSSLAPQSSYLKHLLYYSLLVSSSLIIGDFLLFDNHFQHAALDTKYSAKTPKFMTLKNTEHIYS